MLTGNPESACSGLRVTRVHVTLASPRETPLCGYCSVTLNDCFVIHDLRILRRGDRLFVAMPSRKRACPCGQCGFKNACLARFCNACGSRLADRSSGRPATGADRQTGTERVHIDIAHPLNQEFRVQLEAAVIAEYQHVAAGGISPPHLHLAPVENAPGPQWIQSGNPN